MLAAMIAFMAAAILIPEPSAPHVPRCTVTRTRDCYDLPTDMTPPSWVDTNGRRFYVTPDQARNAGWR